MPAIKKGDLVLLSGASGFLAIHIAQSLLRHGLRVRGTVRTDAKGQYVEQLLGSKDFEYAVVEDVEQESAFDESVRNVQGIVHSASPFHFDVAGDPHKTFINPAVRGTQGILRSALKHNPDVQRIVITSSFAALVNPPKTPTQVYTEADWNQFSLEHVEKEGANAQGVHAYRASKTLAEKAAWDLQKKENAPWDLVTINPPLLWGEPLQQCDSPEKLNESVRQVYDALNGQSKEDIEKKPPGNVVDVRDVAEAHVLGLLEPKAGNNRFSVSLCPYTFADLLELVEKQADPTVAKAFPNFARGVKGEGPSRESPRIDNTKSKDVLGLKYTSVDETVLQMTRKLAERRLNEWKS